MEKNIIKKLNNHILYHQNGQVKEKGNYYIDQIGIYDIEEFQVPVGEWKGWYENGHKEYIEQFNDQGKNEGIFVYWNEHGVKTKEWFYKNGQKHGPFKLWYENGKLSQETVYIDGKKDGLTTKWYEHGGKKMETTFKNGKKDGVHIEWYENGKKSIEGKFKFGVLTSKKVWKEDA